MDHQAESTWERIKDHYVLRVAGHILCRTPACVGACMCGCVPMYIHVEVRAGHGVSASITLHCSFP